MKFKGSDRYDKELSPIYEKRCGSPEMAHICANCGDVKGSHRYDDECFPITESSSLHNIAYPSPLGRMVDADKMLDWLVEMGDHEELSVVEVAEWLNKFHPGILVEYNKRTM